jgi:FtsH-binding integral membrane protein
VTAGDQLAALIGVSLSLVLALRAYRSRKLTFEGSALMVVVWAIIIMVLAFILGRMGL